MTCTRFGRSAEVFAAAALGLLIAATAVAGGRVDQARVLGTSLENNLLGESAERDVAIYLPPSYDSDSRTRYPVLYLLHGIGDSPSAWVQAWDASHPGFATIQELMDHGVAAGTLREMIIVMPDAHTQLTGCFYSDSPVKVELGAFHLRGPRSVRRFELSHDRGT